MNKKHIYFFLKIPKYDCLEKTGFHFIKYFSIRLFDKDVTTHLVAKILCFFNLDSKKQPVLKSSIFKSARTCLLSKESAAIKDAFIAAGVKLVSTHFLHRKYVAFKKVVNFFIIRKLNVCGRCESNTRPLGFQPNALPLSYYHYTLNLQISIL